MKQRQQRQQKKSPDPPGYPCNVAGLNPAFLYYSDPEISASDFNQFLTRAGGIHLRFDHGYPNMEHLQLND
jgi:hypothetical protein